MIIVHLDDGLCDKHNMIKIMNRQVISSYFIIPIDDKRLKCHISDNYSLIIYLNLLSLWKTKC